jgi:hypothetical protein
LSTQQVPGQESPVGKYASVYRGEATGKDTLGRKLQELYRQGREVQRKERIRWQRNRLMYRGEQYLKVVGNSVRTLSPVDRLPSGRRRDTVNMMRPFIDGRVATLTYQRPPFQVFPTASDQETVDAARLATRFIDAMWGVDGWNLDQTFRRLCLTAEIDGVSFLSVLFDRYKGGKVEVYLGPDGQPITDPTALDALRLEDQLGLSLWKQVSAYQGDVVLRVVRPGALSIDPIAQRWEDVRWVIESRIQSKDQVQLETGKPLEQMLKDSKEALGETKLGLGESAQLPGNVSVEEDDGETRQISHKDALLVHEIFLKPGSEFPKGLHAKWLDAAAGDPYIVEPWDDYDLPYRPYNPKPDGGHFLRCRGTADELAPIQVRWNRTLSQVGEWLDRVARPPLIVAAGALRSKSVYNEEGIVQVHGGYPEPRFMSTPAEPTAILNNHLEWLKSTMGEIATMQDASRGQAPGKGVEAAVALNTLIQQNEQNLSATAAEFVGLLEWGVSRALREVGDKYQLPRMIQLPGLDDAADLQAFMGSQLRGCHKFKITGSITPKMRSAQLQTIMMLGQYGGIDLKPWTTQLIEGSVDEIVTNERGQEQRQKRETAAILALGAREDVELKWQEFNQVLTAYAENATKFGGEELSARGVNPPKLRDVGVEVPQPQYFDDDAKHILAMQQVQLSDGYDRLHPLVKQALLEHHTAHLERVHGQAMAVAGQSSGPPGAEPPPAQAGADQQQGDKPPDTGDNSAPQEGTSDSQQ